MENRPDKIKRQVLYQDYGNGGLRVTNVEIMIKFLCLAWIQRLLNNDDKEDDTRSIIPKFYFNKCECLNFLLRFYDKQFLKDGNIPSFYNILFSFLDLKSLHNSDDDQEVIAFNNEEILIDGKSVLFVFFFTMTGLNRVSSRCVM